MKGINVFMLFISSFCLGFDFRLGNLGSFFKVEIIKSGFIFKVRFFLIYFFV